ncbi:MAG TPA: acyltransferase [Cellvibrio sp.]|nr:acyltransferase [Cellvibrio sp.]
MIEKSYISSLTPLRGIAAIWVVLFHIDVSLFYRDLGALISRDATGIFCKGYLWVDFFFLLSGFIIAHVYGESLALRPRLPQVRHYLWARFSRLYPLHLFTFLCLIPPAILLPIYFPQVVDDSWQTYFAWSAVPSNLLLTNAMNQHVHLSWNIVSWSIGAEWWTCVFAIVLIFFMHQRKLWQVSACMLAAFVALAWLARSLPDNNLDITFNYGFFRCFFEFVIGLGLYEFYRQKVARQYLAKDSLFILLLLSLVIIFHWKFYDLSIIPVFLVMILAAAYNRNKLCEILNKPIFQYLGNISYSIYLMHSLWFMVFWFSLPQWKLADPSLQFSPIMKLGYIALFLGLTIISAHFSHQYIEVAGRRYLRKFF